MRLSRIPSLLILLILISSCGTTGPTHYPKSTTLSVKKMYKDSEGSPSYARIRLVNVGVQVFTIDRKKIGPIVKVGTGELVYEAHVKPGKRKILLKATRNYKSYGAFSSQEEAKLEYMLDAKANHVYSFVAVPEGDRVRFAVKDHGPDYDKKCADIFDLKQSAVDNWMKITESGILPRACY